MMTEPPRHATALAGDAMDRRRAPAPRAVWRHPAVLAAVAVAAALLLGWRFLPAAGSTDVDAAAIEMGAVVTGRFEDYLPLRATVAPRVTTLVGALSGGQVERLLVQDGAEVTAGQPLATLSNPTLRLDVLTREAQIAAQLGDLSGQDLARERNSLDRAGQIAQANYDLIKARRDLDVRRQLHAQGFVADAGVRSFEEEAAYQQSRLAQLQSGRAAEARITAQQGARLADTRSRLSGNLAAVREGLDALVVRAPASGRLTNFTVQPGQSLAAGDGVGQVDSEGAWKLEAEVDEYHLGRIRNGQQALIGGGTRATVSKVLPAVSEGRFRIELVFDGAAPPALNRGQTIDLRLTLSAPGQAVLAPVGGWLQAGAGTEVFVIDPDGRHARRRTVRIGRRNPETVEVLDGLRPGERIVTGNTADVRGDTLNIR